MFDEIKEQIEKKMKDLQPGTEQHDKCLKELGYIMSMELKADEADHEKEVREATLNAQFEKNRNDQIKNEQQKKKDAVDTGIKIAGIVAPLAFSVLAIPTLVKVEETGIPSRNGFSVWFEVVKGIFKPTK